MYFYIVLRVIILNDTRFFSTSFAVYCCLIWCVGVPQSFFTVHNECDCYTCNRQLLKSNFFFKPPLNLCVVYTFYTGVHLCTRTSCTVLNNMCRRLTAFSMYYFRSIFLVIFCENPIAAIVQHQCLFRKITPTTNRRIFITTDRNSLGTMKGQHVP